MNAKHVMKKILVFPLLCIGLHSAVAQEEAIALPDVTTVVSGGAITAGKDSVPDYSPVLPKKEDGKVSLPQIADNSGGVVMPEPKPEVAAEPVTKFRLGGGLYTGFPFGDDVQREKIGAGFVGELPFTRFGGNKEFGGAVRLVLGGVIGKGGASGGFAGEFSAGLFLRLPLHKVFALQPMFGYGLALTHVDGTMNVDSDFLFVCAARFIPQGILNGALEFSLAPVFHLMPFSENAKCAFGIRLGALYSFKK